MVISKTLLIKHLPCAFNIKEKEEFLKYFGAKEVKFLSSQYNKYNVAFAKFENENIAKSVLHRLHQAIILDSCLSVEFAKERNITSRDGDGPYMNVLDEQEKNEKYYEQFLEKLSSWHSGFNFKGPVPSHFKYQYPPPSSQALLNILKVLVTVPKFYTQVLHLMNKMNLPCPFGRDILPHIDLNLDPIFKSNTKVSTDESGREGTKEGINTLSTSSESEISSDDDLEHKITVAVPKKQEVKKKMKLRVPKIVKPVSVITSTKAKKTKFEDVFEKLGDEKEAKKIRVNYNISTINVPEQDAVIDTAQDNSGFGYINPIQKSKTTDKEKVVRDEREEERLEKEEFICIRETELAQNRIPEKDRSMLPVFKNYAEGAPTCRLYIKNLAKTVVEADLKFIYHRYLPKEFGAEPNMFDIRLMQEGRMKGQAFVTFQTVELAQKALKETNGYILKDKPLVVQFARSSTK